MGSEKKRKKRAKLSKVTKEETVTNDEAGEVVTKGFLTKYQLLDIKFSLIQNRVSKNFKNKKVLRV